MRLALVSAALTAALALSACGGASIETFDVGNWPIAMAYDGEHLWIANQLDNTVSKLAVDGAILGPYPMPSPMDMVFDGEAIWATNGADGTVTKMALDGSPLGIFQAGSYPVAMVIGGEAIWVANNDLIFGLGEDAVTKLGLDGAYLGTFPLDHPRETSLTMETPSESPTNWMTW